MKVMVLKNNKEALKVFINFNLVLELMKNLDFWSAILGFIGSLLLFFFGLSPKLDTEGHQHLILEQIDEEEKKKALKYKQLGNLGMLLITISFLLQVFNILSK